MVRDLKRVLRQDRPRVRKADPGLHPQKCRGRTSRSSSQYWPNLLNFLMPEMPEEDASPAARLPKPFCKVDAFIGQLMEELKELGIAENTLFIAMADNGPMVHNPPPGWGMLPHVYRGGKGDFTEGGVRVPAFAWWPGVIEPGQLVGDIIHVTDLYTTFARLGGATEHIPDRPDHRRYRPDGDLPQWRHARPPRLRAHLRRAMSSARRSRAATSGTGSAPATCAASGMPEAYYDLYQDPREENPQLVPLIHTQGQFNRCGPGTN